MHHLNGQFAIALWDTRRNRLVLARDRTGIRPLFYSLHDGRLAFASEVKSLLALPGASRRLRADGISEVFTFWSSLAPSTVFDGVLSLPEGYILVVEDGRTKIRRYWDWRFPEAQPATPPVERPVEEEAKELRDLLVDSVRLQLRADVPVGAYLSGGLDSSIIVTLIKHFTETPLRTFSLTFEDEVFDERDFQEDLVHFLGTKHTTVR